MIKVGLVGVGFHSRGAVVPALNACETCELTAAADLNPKNLETLREAGTLCFASSSEMLAETDVDVVYVCTLEDTHKTLVIEALNAGRHVMCEKPLGMNADECREMIRAATENDRTLAVGFEKRYHPDQRQIRRWIAEGRLGRVEAVHHQEMWDGHKTFGPKAERRAAHIDRSGCLDCGVHCLDLTRYLTGGGAWSNVAASGRWFGENERLQAPHISVLADLDTGVLSTLTSSFAYCANIEERRRCFTLTVVGDQGVVNWAWDGVEMLDVTLVDANGVETFPYKPMHHSEAIQMMMGDFCRALSSTDAPWPPELASGEDGLMAQLIVDEALKQTLAKAGR